MSVRIMVILTEEEAIALTQMAEIELREPRDQLRYLLRVEMARRGMITTSEPSEESPQNSDESQKS